MGLGSAPSSRGDPPLPGPCRTGSHRGPGWSEQHMWPLPDLDRSSRAPLARHLSVAGWEKGPDSPATSGDWQAATKEQVRRQLLRTRPPGDQCRWETCHLERGVQCPGLSFTKTERKGAQRGLSDSSRSHSNMPGKPREAPRCKGPLVYREEGFGVRLCPTQRRPLATIC